MTQFAIQSPEDRLTNLVQDWLKDSSADIEQLVAWLNGYDLPAFGHEDPPFLRILRALAESTFQGRDEKKMAERAAKLLKRQPDIQPVEPRPEEFLYNLFMLCAGLGCPEQLADGLYALFERQRAISEKQQIDTEVAAALRYALTENQIDDRMVPIWLNLVSSKTDSFLGGNLYDALRGIVSMPPDKLACHSQGFEAIGIALTQIAIRLATAQDRRAEFRMVIAEVVEAIPNRSTWPEELIHLADRRKWPTWAVECLPSLVIVNSSEEPAKTTKGVKSYVWKYIGRSIPDSLAFEVIGELCRGDILEMTLDASAAQFVAAFAPSIEVLRLLNPYPSERSMIGIVNDHLAQFTEPPGNIETALGQVDFHVIRKRLIDHGFAESLPLDLDMLGDYVTSIVESRDLTEFGRRIAFIRTIECIVARDPTRRTWRNDLRQQAKRCGWPAWAADCLDHALAV